MIQEVQAKSILNKNKHPSGWFGMEYGMNIYRGCQYQCIYCDSRSECYRIENFDDIIVKVNAPELLQKELARKRKRGTIGTGAMSDPYMPLEKEYNLTGKCLEIISHYRYPVNICTKSNLILRDIELLQKINEVYACIAFTITTTDDELAKKIEPRAPLPSERLKAMGILSSLGIKTGILMMPLLPFIEDNEENIESIVKKSAHYGGSFIIPSFGMTLRDRQRLYYYDKLDEHFPGLREKYEKRFKNSYSCGVNNYTKLKNLFNQWCSRHNISTKMPSYQQKVTNSQMNFFGEIK
ncbi:MAG: radical SAM protein [Clostridia bacterium]|nr:radical SAM protein [Clostridia bacterium]